MPSDDISVSETTVTASASVIHSQSHSHGARTDSGSGVVIDKDISAAVLRSYTSIRDLMEKEARRSSSSAAKAGQAHMGTVGSSSSSSGSSNIEVPRLCVCGEQTAGKSSLVEQFIGFPCSFTKQGVGTRCPVSYTLKRNAALTTQRIVQPPNTGLQQLADHVLAHMTGLGEGFSHIPLRIEIEGPQLPRLRAAGPARLPVQ